MIRLSVVFLVLAALGLAGCANTEYSHEATSKYTCQKASSFGNNECQIVGAYPPYTVNCYSSGTHTAKWSCRKSNAFPDLSMCTEQATGGQVPTDRSEACATLCGTCDDPGNWGEH